VPLAALVRSAVAKRSAAFRTPKASIA